MSNLPRAVATGEAGTADVVSAWRAALVVGPVVAIALWLALGDPDRLPAQVRWLAGTHHELVPTADRHIEFREVIDGDALRSAAPLDEAADPRVEIDSWRPENGDPQRTDYYLTSHDRAKLEQLVAGLVLPANTEIKIEKLAVASDARDQRPRWRTYLVTKDAALDEHAIQDAIGVYDPNTNRPLVALTFTEQGGQAFYQLTRRIVGHKLATIWGNDIVTVPVINSPIPGGRAVIAMGGTDALEAERDRDRIVEALHRGSPTYLGVPDPVRRIGSSLVVGLVIAALTFVILFVTRPERYREPVIEGAGGKLGKRLAWTAFGLVVYAIGTKIVIPGIDEVELAHVVSSGLRSRFDEAQVSIFCLGITPLIAGYAIVEVVAAIVPPWRKARVTLGGRKRLDLAAAIASAVIAIVQGYFTMLYLSSLDRGGSEIWNPHLRFAAWSAISAGPMLLAAVGAMMSARGLGNGFVWLLVFGWIWSLPATWLGELPAGQWLASAVTVAVIAWLVSRLAAWRIRSLGRATLPLPTSGITPVADAAGLVVVARSFSLLALSMPHFLIDLNGSALRNIAFGAAMLVGVTVLWSVVFARPGRYRELLAPSEPFDLPQWLRGVVLTGFLLLAIYAVGIVMRPFIVLPHLLESTTIALATMLAIDVHREWRARRAMPSATAVWALHDPVLVEPARDRLADIPHFITMTNSRTLYWLFAPYVPMQVHVPAERALEAHERLRAWLDS